MRLVRSSFHTYHLPYSRPVKWSDIVEEGGSFLLLRLESEEGHVGVAEMVTKPTWTGFGMQSLAAAVSEVLLPRLSGADISDETQVAAKLQAIPGMHAPKALLDNALWDLRAAAQADPLWRNWGGVSRVPVSYTVTRQAPDLMARQAAQMVDRYGFNVLKIKGGQGVEQDLSALRALRAAVGDNVGFYVDANSAYSTGVAQDYARAMFDAGARVVEDPCALLPNHDFAMLQSALPGPLLVDFNCWGVDDMRLFMMAGASAFSLKPGRLGLSTTRAMRSIAHGAQAITVTGMFGESALGTWQALALASTLGHTSLPAEVTWFLEMQEQVLDDIPSIKDGAIDMPAWASVADRVNWQRVQHLAVAPAIETNHT